MTGISKNHTIYLDHIFILTQPGAEVAEQLVQMGLVEGNTNTHPGQGTSNRRFFLNRFTIELLYISDAKEAEYGAGKGLGLFNRSIHADASPFGIVCRVTDPESAPIFDHWRYYPEYFKGDMCFYVGKNSSNLAEPLCICMPPKLPLNKNTPKEYENPGWDLTSVSFEVPVESSSEELAYFTMMDNIEVVNGKRHKLTIVLNEGILGKELDLEHTVPIVLKW